MTNQQPKLTFQGMLQHFEGKNVKFDFISKEEAVDFLQTKNYFFRLTSYRTNFTKDRTGKYINLDFSMLRDLSVIDFQLRKFVLNIALSIEHNLKTTLLKLITNDPNEDGYTIIQDFLNHSSLHENELWGHARKEENTLTYSMYQKYKDKPPVWVIFEIISFPHLVRFAEFYEQTRNQNLDVKIKKTIPYLKFVKFLRNGAAHNNPLIRELKGKDFHYSQAEAKLNDVRNFARKAKGIHPKHYKYLKNKTIHHLVATLFVYDSLNESIEAKRHTYRELQEFVERCRKNKKMYNESHNQIVAMYIFIKKISAYLNEKVKESES